MKIESLGVQSSRLQTSESGSRVEQVERQTATTDAVTFERDRNKNWKPQDEGKKKKKKNPSDPETEALEDVALAAEAARIDIIV